MQKVNGVGGKGIGKGVENGIRNGGGLNLVVRSNQEISRDTLWFLNNQSLIVIRFKNRTIATTNHYRFYSSYNSDSIETNEDSIDTNSDSIETNTGSAPVLSYENADLLKKDIIKDNKSKCGVYRWVNLNNGKSYIGSSTNLSARFRNYFNYKHISNPKFNSVIYKALIKYDYPSFRLEILEYCSKEEVLSREQFYLDSINPEYNLCKVAGSPLGVKRSEETKAKMSQAFYNRSPEYHAINLKRVLELNAEKGHQIEVMQVDTNETKNYSSIRQAVSELGFSHGTIRKYLENKKEYKNYKFTYEKK
jgi:hypothetical protein